MTPKKIPFNYDINRMDAVNLISIIHIDDYDTRFLELILSNEGSPLDVDGCTVTARFVTAREKYLLRDDVPCVAEGSTITIPIDAAAVNNMACDIKIEVNIVDGAKVLTLPFPLWIRVRGSILDDAQVTPESEGTIPDLLKAAQEALNAATAALEEAGDYSKLDNKPQINGHTLSGNKTSSELGLQDKLTAGGNVTIDENGVISATGGTDDYNDLSNKPQINGFTLSGDKTGPQLGLQNTINIPTPSPSAYDQNIYLKLLNNNLTFQSQYVLSLQNDKFPAMSYWGSVNGFAQLTTNSIADEQLTVGVNGNVPVNENGTYIRLGSYDSRRRVEFYLTIFGDKYQKYSVLGGSGEWFPGHWIKNSGGSQIVSGVVNQDGTITFTDSGGNTFTTTGASVIGPQGAPGQDYVLTNQDKTDIANEVLELLPNADTMLFPEVSEVNNE